MSEEVKTIEEAVELCLETTFWKDRNGVRIKKDRHSNLNQGRGWAGKGGTGDIRRDWGDGTKEQNQIDLVNRETQAAFRGEDPQKQLTDFNAAGREVPYYRESKEKLYNVLKNCFDEVNEILPKYKTSYKLVDELEKRLNETIKEFISGVESKQKIRQKIKPVDVEPDKNPELPQDNEPEYHMRWHNMGQKEASRYAKRNPDGDYSWLFANRAAT